ncbi:MAG: NFACT family protein [Lachnospiraceae bacterium]|nr:NFACT family protein [Lachnospiraceae bacterium]
MAFDGITIAALTAELREKLEGGRLYKIAQPEKDELLLTIKNNSNQYRLLISANASLPLLYLTDDNKKSPMNAPNFCMLLRKHVQNARITAVKQPGLERVVHFHMEHLNEMGDLCTKILTVELMGKYSNIIFRDEEKIIDSMKHISIAVSSVREVLPGRDYFIPGADEKMDLLQPDWNLLRKSAIDVMAEKSVPAQKFIYQNFTGIAPIVGTELCYRAGVDGDKPTNALDDAEKNKLIDELQRLREEVQKENFMPVIVYDGETPKEFGVLPYSIYKGMNQKEFASVSGLLKQYYEEKSTITRIRQKSVDLRKIVQTAVERNAKKLDLQNQQLKDTQKREKYKVYGELLHTYGYEAKEGDKSITVINYYDGNELTIPLDPDLTPMENAKKYFDKYGKLKRTYEALTVLSKETEEELHYLESVMMALDMAREEDDLTQIKEELVLSGYVKKKGNNKKAKVLSKPLHYISGDGYHMYVGKNNYQNEEITFQMAEGGDWWFHAKGMPGSHVIVKCKGAELPDQTFEEAARLAAYYSKGNGQDKVEIDYIQKKHVKKPNGSKPGFVVYYTNYSMMIDTDISNIRQVES